MKNKFPSLILALSALVSLSANALVIEHDVDFTLGNFGSSTATTGSYLYSDPSTTTASLGLQRFDTSLGTLTDVNISFTSDWTHRSYASAYDTSSESTRYTRRIPYSCYRYGRWTTCYTYRTYYRYSNDTRVNAYSTNAFSISLVDPSSADEFLTSTDRLSCSRSIDYNGRAYCNDSDLSSGSFSAGFDLSGFSLDLFEADGVDDILNFNLSNFTNTYGYCDNNYRDYGDRCYANTRSSWGGNIKVSYTYDATSGRPNGVPEPSVLALFALGMVGLGFGMRRKSQRG